MKDELSQVSYNNRDNFIVSKTNDSNDRHDKNDSNDKYDKYITGSRFEPDCVKRAREIPEINALKLLVSWLKKRGLTESQRHHQVKAFLRYHNLKDLPNDELLEILAVPPFTCNFAKELGLCLGEECSEKLPPADRLIMDTEYAILFHSVGRLRVKAAGRKKDIDLVKLYSRKKDGIEINTKVLDELYIECYYIPPNPPITQEEAIKVVQTWLEEAEIVKEALDPESNIEEAIIELITAGRDQFFSVSLLKSGKVRPRQGFFVDGDVLLIESNLLRDRLEELGVSKGANEIRKAVQHLLAGRSKLMRYGPDNKQRAYFWRFSIPAIQAILRKEGDDWQPELSESPVALADLMKQVEAEEVEEETEEVDSQ